MLHSMRVYCIAAFLVLFTFQQSFAAQWKAILKTIIQDQNNTLLFLQYTPSELNFKDFKVEVAFQSANSYQIIYEKEFSVQVREATVITIPFKFDVGEYIATIDILERKNNQHFLFQVPYQCTADLRQTSLSDILLSYNAFTYEDRFESKKLTPTLNPTRGLDSDSLYFWMEIYAPRDGAFLGKAVIFRKAVSSKLDTSRVADEATPYTSEDEKYFFPQVKGGIGIYTDWFSVDSLKEGEYQLFVYIYDEDDIFIDDKTVSFIVKGSLEQKILADLATSIRMMKYTAFSEVKIQELLSISDPNEQEKAFKLTWHQLFTSRNWDGELGEEEQTKMEQYYQRIYDANAMLGPSGENWDSDRGRIYVQYDKPSLKNKVKIGNKNYERWTYGQWDLSFLFEETLDGYVLID